MDRLVTQAQSDFFSDDDIRKWLGDHVRILKFCDLAKYSSLQQACGPGNMCVILFETDMPNMNGHTGHWVCFFQVDDVTWEWFDSYGVRPGSERDFVTPEVLEETKADVPLIEKLIANAPDHTKMIYNQVRLQQLKKGIDTCGRWVCIRLLKRKIPLARFQELFLDTKQSGDWIVTCMTML